MKHVKIDSACFSCLCKSASIFFSHLHRFCSTEKQLIHWNNKIGINNWQTLMLFFTKLANFPCRLTAQCLLCVVACKTPHFRPELIAIIKCKLFQRKQPLAIIKFWGFPSSTNGHYRPYKIFYSWHWNRGKQTFSQAIFYPMPLVFRNPYLWKAFRVKCRLFAASPPMGQRTA